MILDTAGLVIFVPGYGMAVAQAQHQVRELDVQLQERGAEVLYAIHPVAGRMPGHMNVLLAEADVPYDQLQEMDAINPTFPRADVAIVLGANDVVNPAARADKSPWKPQPAALSCARNKRGPIWQSPASLTACCAASKASATRYPKPSWNRSSVWA